MNRVSILLAAALLYSPHCLAEQIYPGYDWQEIKNDIYLHTRSDPLAGPVDGNSVVIVNPTEVFVVDTHINPAAARAVIAKIRQITDKPVTRIINTHWHDDHTNGNHAYREAFPNVSIIAHQATLTALEEGWQEMEDGRREAYAKVDAQQVLDAADALEDPNQAIGYRLYAGYVAALKPELPTMRLVYPDTVFKERMQVQSGNRRMIIEWIGKGNTEGDVIVHLPDDGILITGDLLVSPVPFAFDSPMLDWAATLGRMSRIDAGIIIPGHGPVQYDMDHVRKTISLLLDTVDEVDRAHGRGATLENLELNVDLDAQAEQFTMGDPALEFAWGSYFLTPGLKSAWVSLGLPATE